MMSQRKGMDKANTKVTVTRHSTGHTVSAQLVDVPPSLKTPAVALTHEDIAFYLLKFEEWASFFAHDDERELFAVIDDGHAVAVCLYAITKLTAAAEGKLDVAIVVPVNDKVEHWPADVYRVLRAFQRANFATKSAAPSQATAGGTLDAVPIPVPPSESLETITVSTDGFVFLGLKCDADAKQMAHKALQHEKFRLYHAATEFAAHFLAKELLLIRQKYAAATGEDASDKFNSEETKLAKDLEMYDAVLPWAGAAKWIKSTCKPALQIAAWTVAGRLCNSDVKETVDGSAELMILYAGFMMAVYYQCQIDRDPGWAKATFGGKQFSAETVDARLQRFEFYGGAKIKLPKAGAAKEPKDDSKEDLKAVKKQLKKLEDENAALQQEREKVEKKATESVESSLKALAKKMTELEKKLDKK